MLPADASHCDRLVSYIGSRMKTTCSLLLFSGEDTPPSFVRYPRRLGSRSVVTSRDTCCDFQGIKSSMAECRTGWCGRGDHPRTFLKRSPVVCYDKPAAASVNRTLYDTLRHEALLGERILELLVPKKSARTWTMQHGDLCRITVSEGSQVGDVNFWNIHNTKERFYSGKTRQLHSAHLTLYDRLWSSLPYLRSMATVVGDSLKSYGIDEDGASVHDVIGTRCDNYTMKLITGKDSDDSCHSYLTKAVEKVGLKEEDVHDVWNIFMCTGFTRDTHQYFTKASPAQKGDYIEFVADMDLLVALSTCPHGDVSIAVGQEIPDSICHPLQVEVFRATEPSVTLPPLGKA